MSLINRLSNKVAQSPKGRELIGKAQAIANDPKNREKLEEARGKLNEQIGAAKHKLAEKRGEKPGGPGQSTTPPPPPAHGDDGPKAA
ncbi:MAG TPA: hypothetical protein VG474_10050 [Solirubrobacteraceae bacterium]|nr:hypothetical protein [Solirubrobacteraceae bacterium]